MRKKIILFISLIVLIIFPACTKVIDNKAPIDNQYKNIRSFSSIEEYRSFLRNNELNMRPYGGIINMHGTTTNYKTLPMEENRLQENVAKKDIEFSNTNNQVKGVDEADIIKTDGKYIYTISNNIVYIIYAYPGENASVKSTINLPFTPKSLFIQDNKLVVIGLNNNRILPRLSSGSTRINIYNIDNKNKPLLLHNISFEGYYNEARLYNNKIYLITNSNLRYDPVYPTPIRIMDGNVKNIPLKNIFYFPIPYSYPILVNLFSLDMSSYNIDSKSFMIDGTPQLYMSKNNIYLASNSIYVNKYNIRMNIMKNVMQEYISNDAKRLIKKINNVDNEILSGKEKESKIQKIIMQEFYTISEDKQKEIENIVDKQTKNKIKKYESRSYFEIYKISLKNLEFINKVELPGKILNQFSMDEYKGIFRVATTVTPWNYSREHIDNRIYTFDNNLKELDKLDNIAKGERIYSTRFIGDKIYVVTFKNIDPLFVIDASNPKKIKLVGKLKIPGFSRYLHPYDNTTLIGIGRETNEEGRQEGLKISLFDVSDLKNPKEIAKFTTDEKYSNSIAEYEHKAFLFSKEKNLLVIPIYARSWDINEKEMYNGAMVFHINKTNIKLRGIIDHSIGGANYYSTAVERSLYIDNLIYTKSKTLLRINKIETLESVKNVTLTVKNSKYKTY